MRAMRRSSPVRRLVALATAYVVALQLVVLPLTVAASNALSSPLCSQLAASALSPAKSDPLKADTGCACAAGCGTQCCAQGDAAAPSATMAIEWKGVAAPLPPPIFAAFDFRHERGPHNPRAPPVA